MDTSSSNPQPSRVKEDFVAEEHASNQVSPLETTHVTEGVPLNIFIVDRSELSRSSIETPLRDLMANLKETIISIFLGTKIPRQRTTAEAAVSFLQEVQRDVAHLKSKGINVESLDLKRNQVIVSIRPAIEQRVEPGQGRDLFPVPTATIVSMIGPKDSSRITLRADAVPI